MQQQEGLREHKKNEPPRYIGNPPVNRGDGVARKKNTGKQGKPVNWRPVNQDIDCVKVAVRTIIFRSPLFILRTLKY